MKFCGSLWTAWEFVAQSRNPSGHRRSNENADVGCFPLGVALTAYLERCEAPPRRSAAAFAAQFATFDRAAFRH
jgi:hypothetical protein